MSFEILAAVCSLISLTIGCKLGRGIERGGWIIFIRRLSEERVTDKEFRRLVENAAKSLDLPD